MFGRPYNSYKIEFPFYLGEDDYSPNNIRKWINKLVLSKDDFEAQSYILLTIVGIKHYFGTKAFKIGEKVHLMKELHDPHDPKAVIVYADGYGKCGYIANSKYTIAEHTLAADYIHDIIDVSLTAEIAIIEDEYAICIVEMNCFELAFKHAVKFCEDGYVDIALDIFEVLHTRYEDIPLLQRICDCHLKLKQYCNATFYVDRAMELDPTNEITLYLKKLVYDI